MQSDSREKIVLAARRAFYERGYENTSLADVAALSGVPKGNFYYHFRTKAELMQAVLEARTSDVSRALESWQAEIHTPEARLMRFARMIASDTEDLVRYGCPVGSLVTELSKNKTDTIHEGALSVLELYIAWTAKQFAELGHSAKSARALGERLLARCQGAILIAHAYGDPSLLKRELREIEGWLHELASS